MSTFYRLLVAVDHQEVELFDITNAFEHDSAKPGASAIESSETRALFAELAKAENKTTIQILWDFNFFRQH